MLINVPKLTAPVSDLYHLLQNQYFRHYQAGDPGHPVLKTRIDWKRFSKRAVAKYDHVLADAQAARSFYVEDLLKQIFAEGKNIEGEPVALLSIEQIADHTFGGSTSLAAYNQERLEQVAQAVEAERLDWRWQAGVFNLVDNWQPPLIGTEFVTGSTVIPWRDRSASGARRRRKVAAVAFSELAQEVATAEPQSVQDRLVQKASMLAFDQKANESAHYAQKHAAFTPPEPAPEPAQAPLTKENRTQLRSAKPLAYEDTEAGKKFVLDLIHKLSTKAQASLVSQGEAALVNSWMKAANLKTYKAAKALLTAETEHQQQQLSEAKTAAEKAAQTRLAKKQLAQEKALAQLEQELAKFAAAQEGAAEGHLAPANPLADLKAKPSQVTKPKETTEAETASAATVAAATATKARKLHQASAQTAKADLATKAEQALAAQAIAYPQFDYNLPVLGRQYDQATYADGSFDGPLYVSALGSALASTNATPGIQKALYADKYTNNDELIAQVGRPQGGWVYVQNRHFTNAYTRLGLSVTNPGVTPAVSVLGFIGTHQAKNWAIDRCQTFVDERAVLDDPAEFGSYSRIGYGDLVVVRTSSADTRSEASTLGTARVYTNAEYMAMPHMHCMVVSLKPEVNPFWVALVTRSSWFKQHVMQVANISTIANISIEAYKKLEVPIPAREVQDRLAQYFFTLYQQISLARETATDLQELLTKRINNTFKLISLLHSVTAAQDEATPQSQDQAAKQELAQQVAQAMAQLWQQTVAQVTTAADQAKKLQDAPEQPASKQDADGLAQLAQVAASLPPLDKVEQSLVLAQFSVHRGEKLKVGSLLDLPYVPEGREGLIPSYSIRGFCGYVNPENKSHVGPAIIIPAHNYYQAKLTFIPEGQEFHVSPNVLYIALAGTKKRNTWKAANYVPTFDEAYQLCYRQLLDQLAQAGKIPAKRRGRIANKYKEHLEWAATEATSQARDLIAKRKQESLKFASVTQEEQNQEDQVLTLRFLYHQLKYSLVQYAKGIELSASAIKPLTSRQLEALPVYLPPIAYQGVFVGIFDQVENQAQTYLHAASKSEQDLLTLLQALVVRLANKAKI